LCALFQSAMLIRLAHRMTTAGNLQHMALSSALAPGASQLAGTFVTGRAPGMAVFAAGLLAGALIVAVASWLERPIQRNRAADGNARVPPAVTGAAPVAPVPARGVTAAQLAAPDDCSAAGASKRPADLGQGSPRPADPESGNGPSPGLLIGVLGSLTVNGQAGALVPAQSQLLVALALHRGGLANGQLRRLLGADALHPKPADSLRQLIARTRRALGQAPGNREWIEHLGHGHYALHPDAWLDWRVFETLTAAGMQSREAPPLEDALTLVRGEPFTGCYYWWLEPELVESVRARVVSAAEALATLKLASRNPAAAARAARIGLAADSSAEQLWRIVMRAEHAAGNLAGVRGAWDRCRNVVSEVAADGRPDPATTAVYTRLLAR
jgi:DNA-binding SARP family transcriptional activator